MSKKLDIITIGESLIELSSNESITTAPYLDKYYGGDTLVTAISALRLGSDVGYISRIGMDCFMDFLLESWQTEGLDISQVKPVKEFNGLYVISRPQNFEKEFAYYRKKTAATNLSTDDISEEYIQSASIIYSTGVTQSLSLSARDAITKAFLIAKANHLLTAYDPNFDERIWSLEEAKEAFEEISDKIDILFINTKKDSQMILETDSYTKLIKYFWDKGISTVVIKSSADHGYYTGASGSITFTDFTQKDIVDTTGAGDTFNGAFLHAITKGLSPFEATKLAAISAGLQAKNIGAVKSIPFKKDVYSVFKGCNE